MFLILQSPAYQTGPKTEPVQIGSGPKGSVNDYLKLVTFLDFDDRIQLFPIAYWLYLGTLRLCQERDSIMNITTKSVTKIYQLSSTSM